MKTIEIDKDQLTIDDVVAVSRGRVPITISAAGVERVDRASRLVARWVREEKVIYGITTGFGAMCNVTISPQDTRSLQKKILMSHAAGVGDPFPETRFWHIRPVWIRFPHPPTRRIMFPWAPSPSASAVRF